MPAARLSSGETKADGPAVDAEFAFGRLQVAGHNVHQGRLARTVLADHGMDFAWPETERNLVERKDAGEPFGDPAISTISKNVQRALRHARASRAPGCPAATLGAAYFLATSAMFSLV